jgi:MoaA/NifB/PqqE/SkfB family radical SAM enzyme
MPGGRISNLKRMVKKDLRNRLYPFFWNFDRVPIKPIYVSVQVADTCFFRCKHCDLWKMKPSNYHMNLPEYKMVLRKIHDWLGDIAITFSGGEPFLNPDLALIVEEASRLGFTTYVNTNGFLVDKEKMDKLATAGINGIHISIDSLGHEHDWSRGRSGAFKKAEAVIKLLKKTKQENKYGFELGITTILMKQKLGSVDALINWAEGLGVEAVYFQALNENFGAAGHNPDWHRKSILWPDKEMIEAAIKRLIELKKAGKIIGSSFSQMNDYLDYYQLGPREYGMKNRCYVGLKNLSIGMNGDVNLCSVFEPVGNVLTESLPKLWKGLKAGKQRRKIRACKRGCRVLLCNTRSNLNLREIVKIIKEKLKR